MKIKKKKALSWLLIFVFMGMLTACSSKARQLCGGDRGKTGIR